MIKRKRDVYEQADDDEASLFASIKTKSLDEIVTDNHHLYTTPPFWTRSHEKILRVVWRPFRPSLLNRQAYLQHTQSLGLGQRRREETKQIRQDSPHSPASSSSSDSQRTIPLQPRRRLSWHSRHKPLSTPSQPPGGLLSPAPPLMPNLEMLFFELLEGNLSSLISDICCLQNDGGGAYAINKKVTAMLRLLSGVNKYDTFNVLENISPSDTFLRADVEGLGLFYGKKRYRLLHGTFHTFVYRLGIKRNKFNSNDTCSDCPGPFWRMLHLDYVHANAATFSNRFGRNFRFHGIRRRGMTMDEYKVRYDYERGCGKWSQPHFIPGFFIAMEQRYRRLKWNGQKRKKNAQKTADHDQQENTRGRKRERKGKPEHSDNHRDQIDNGGDASSVKPLDENNGQVGTTSSAAPTWQILFTDGHNDHVYAHLYTAQVPPFLIDCFQKPSQWHSPNPTTSAESNGAAEKKNGHGHAQEDASFDFTISHTRIKYQPYISFPQRLRRAIVRSHYEYSVAEKEAGPLETEEWESGDEELEDGEPDYGDPREWETEDEEQGDGDPMDTSD
ncbi:hypothetical protein F5Y03DRAFT_57891 [Xylaria venustula]|nr:hypothetical protein F5Y03DRAFT_57891 [Xylaria venustula]